MITQPTGMDQLTAAMPLTVTGPAENLAMYQASKRPATAPEQITTVEAPRPIHYKTSTLSSLNATAFPQNLHAMVTETAATQPELISWIEDGEAFKLHQPKSAKLGAVLEKHFSRKYGVLFVLVSKRTVLRF